MICAVPLHRLKPMTAFMVDLGRGPVVGVLERIPDGRGYAQVVYSGGTPRSHKFKSRDGEDVDFTDSGHQRAEWSAGTLVRPIEEDDMSDSMQLVEAVGGAAASKQEIRDKVVALKAKAGAKVGAKTGLAAKLAKSTPKAKAEPKPKAEKVMKPCRCYCGTQTGGTFAPGHDARYYGWLKKIVSGDKDFKELPKPLQKEFVDVKGVKKALDASNH